MGTRHLIAVMLDGEYKVAQYGQWDGYLEGAGCDVLAFLHTVQVPNFYDQVRKLTWIDEEVHKNLWVEAGADPESEFVNYDVAKHFGKMYPELSRDTGANILDIVAEGKVQHGLHNSIDFADDSVFCEWAYVIDLDKGTFEVYKGFNKRPLPETDRFYKKERDAHGYWPVRHIRTYSLWNLPTIGEFMASFDNEEEGSDESG